jgi:hypothetical protein
MTKLIDARVSMSCLVGKEFGKLAYMLAAVACLSLLFAAGTRAQNSADILGTVTDASGGVVPGANVTLTNTATNISQTLQSSAGGEYTFTLLVPATYSLKVEAKGFKTFSVPSITVAGGDRARQDVTMAVGEQSTTVEVQATSTPALQTDTSNIGALVTQQGVEDLPLNGRNLTQLIQLEPGVSVGAQNDLPTGNRPDDRRATSEYTVNGNGTTLNNNMIDGLDNNERFIGTVGVRPSVDAIQEVVIQTNLYDASAGRTGGGVVNVITKSGSNNFHGSAYEFFRNAVLNTNPNYQFPAGYSSSGAEQLTTALGKPAFRQNQYGASLGGPIRKDKTFFFGDFEQFKQAYGDPLTGSVPTLCQRGSKMAAAQGYSGAAITCPDGSNPVNPGDFSELATISAFGGSSGTGAAHSGPVIPLSSMNPVGLALFSSYPLPNSPALSNNYTSNPLRTQNSTTFDVRIDHHFSDKDTFFSRYSFNDVTTLTPTNFPVVTITPAIDPLWTGSPLTFNPGGQSANFPGTAKQRQQQLGLSYVHIFSPNLLLNLKAGYLRSVTRSVPPEYQTNVSNALGIACNPTNCINFGSRGASGLALFTNGYTQLGDEGFIPLFNVDNTFQYSGGLTWNRGNQSIKIGLGLIRRQVGEYQSSNGNGTFTFSGDYTGVAAGDFLEGLASTAARSYYITSPVYLTWEPNVYLQDDWRVRHWLTLNLGIRYDIFTPYTERRGRISNFNPATGLIDGPSIPGAQQSGPTALSPTPYKDISPRFGFAATLSHNFVVRGGFGLTFYPAGPAIGTLRNAPFNFTFSCSVQNTGQSSVVCPTSIANTAVAEYGAAVSSPSSPVGQTGGNAVASGLPVPVLSVNNVFAPSAAQCTFTTNAAYSPTPSTGTCPSTTNPYTNGIGGANWPNYTDGVLEGFNLQVQKEFGGNVVTLGYVGQLGRHAFVGYSPNHISNNLQNSVDPLATSFPWLAKTSITEVNAPWGTTSYNSLQATFVRRFNKGLTVSANYTWSHALLNSNAVCTPTISFSMLGIGNGPQYTNPCFYDNPASIGSPFTVTQMLGGAFGVANATLDVPNRVSGTADYQLPFGKSMAGAEGLLVKGWTVNGAATWQSGAPFTVGTGITLPGVGGGRPDQICAGNTGPKTLAAWEIVPSCFQIATQNTYGNELGSQFFGPRNKYANFSIFKEFPLKENIRLQFRTEIFNLFNTPNFSAPSVTSVPFYNGTAAQCGALGAGNCGTGLAQNPSSLTSNKLGAITTLNNNYNSRQIQFALKLLF